MRIGELPDSNMIATRIGSLRPIVCASPAFLARSTPPREPDELVKYACVVFNSPYLSPWRFRLPSTRKVYEKKLENFRANL